MQMPSHAQTPTFIEMEKKVSGICPVQNVRMLRLLDAASAEALSMGSNGVAWG